MKHCVLFLIQAQCVSKRIKAAFFKGGLPIGSFYSFLPFNFLDRWASASDQVKYQADKKECEEDIKENLRNRRKTTGYTAKTKKCRDKCQDEENNCPIKHSVPFLPYPWVDQCRPCKDNPCLGLKVPKGMGSASPPFPFGP